MAHFFKKITGSAIVSPEKTHRRGEVTLQLVSNLTGLASVVSVQTNNNFFLVRSNPIVLNWRPVMEKLFRLHDQRLATSVTR